MTYRIRDWDTQYENNRTKEIKRMTWVPVPNRMDGQGYTELVDHPNGAAHLGAWLAIIEISSRQKIRGTFPQDDAGIPQVLARMSRLPAGLFEEVIPRLLKIGWIECIQEDADIPQEPAELFQPAPQFPASSRAREERKRTEGNGTEENGPQASAATTALLFQTEPAARFEEFIAPWLQPGKRCSSQRAAAHAWASFIKTQDDVRLAFQARDRYIESGEWEANVVMEPANFLKQQAESHWTGNWPVPKTARASPGIEKVQRTVEIAKAIDRRMGR